MSRALAACALAACGCSFTFDGSQPLLPLTGHPAPPEALQRIELADNQEVSLLRDADGVSWAAIYSVIEGVGISGPVRVARLADPVIDFDYDAALETEIGREKIFFIDRERDGDYIEARRPGEPRSFAQTILSGVLGQAFVSSPRDDAFVLVPHDLTQSLTLARSDGSFNRPFDTDRGLHIGFPVFGHDGNWLFTYESDGTVMAHSTVSVVDRMLGHWVPSQLGVRSDDAIVDWPDGGALVVCDARGVTVLQYSPFLGERSLDDATCRVPPDGVGPPLPAVADGHFVYLAGNLVRSVALDGSSPPRFLYELQFQQQVVAWTPAIVAYSTNPPDQFVAGAGDGWVGGWRFMERGIGAAFSRDLTRVRYLEHAADDQAAGELRASAFGGGFRRLASNVIEFDELPDGRVLAASNHAFDGYQNRLIVVDETAGTARWVADSAERYTLIPGSTDVLAQLHTDLINLDHVLVRVPLPAAGAP